MRVSGRKFVSAKMPSLHDRNSMISTMASQNFLNFRLNTDVSKSQTLGSKACHFVPNNVFFVVFRAAKLRICGVPIGIWYSLLLFLFVEFETCDRVTTSIVQTGYKISRQLDQNRNVLYCKLTNSQKVSGYNFEKLQHYSISWQIRVEKKRWHEKIPILMPVG